MCRGKKWHSNISCDYLLMHWTVLFESLLTFFFIIIRSKNGSTCTKNKGVYFLQLSPLRILLLSVPKVFWTFISMAFYDNSSHGLSSTLGPIQSLFICTLFNIHKSFFGLFTIAKMSDLTDFGIFIVVFLSESLK